MNMHDWTLLGMTISWAEGIVVVSFRNPSSSVVELRAVEARLAKVDRSFPWGESVSVSEVVGPVEIDGGFSFVDISMQSGDVLRIEAREFVFPL